MSEYRDFFQDFPSRSVDLLNSFYENASNIDREVTLSIAMSYGALLFPFERLRTTSKTPHPTNDCSNNAKHAENFKNQMEKRFCDFRPRNPFVSWDWYYGKQMVDLGDVKRAANEATKMLISKEKKVSSIIKLIRNSLAHSNILTFESPIEWIVFYSCKPPREDEQVIYPIEIEFLRTSPILFKNFLIDWVQFLQINPLSLEDYRELIENAE